MKRDPRPGKNPEPGRGQALSVLNVRIAQAVAAGVFPPCVEGTSGDWTSDDAAAAALAATACDRCPVLDMCRKYVCEWPERAGVWGGWTASDRNPSPRPRRRSAAS